MNERTREECTWKKGQGEARLRIIKYALKSISYRWENRVQLRCLLFPYSVSSAEGVMVSRQSSDNHLSNYPGWHPLVASTDLECLNLLSWISFTRRTLMEQKEWHSSRRRLSVRAVKFHPSRSSPHHRFPAHRLLLSSFSASFSVLQLVSHFLVNSPPTPLLLESQPDSACECGPIVIPLTSIL